MTYASPCEAFSVMGLLFLDVHFAELRENIDSKTNDNFGNDLLGDIID